MSANEEKRSLNSLIKEIKMNSRGWIETAIAVSEDGTLIAYENELINPEYIATATAAICGVVSYVMDLVNAKNYKRVNIEFEDGRRLLITRYKGNYIVCLTKSKPNMGFVEILLEAHLSE